MIYAIGGYSFAEFGFKQTAAIPSVSLSLRDSTKEEFDGFHIGAGFETMLTDSITARLEYRYTDYSREDFDLNDFDFIWKPPRMQEQSALPGCLMRPS
jgi:outer membrane immunogenic protein